MENRKIKKEVAMFKLIKSYLESEEEFVIEWETGLRGMLAKNDLRFYWNLNKSHYQFYKIFQGFPTISRDAKEIKNMNIFLDFFYEALERVENPSEEELRLLKKTQLNRKPRGKSKKDLDIYSK